MDAEDHTASLLEQRGRAYMQSLDPDSNLYEAMAADDAGISVPPGTMEKALGGPRQEILVNPETGREVARIPVSSYDNLKLLPADGSEQARKLISSGTMTALSDAYGTSGTPQELTIAQDRAITDASMEMSNDAIAYVQHLVHDSRTRQEDGLEVPSLTEYLNSGLSPANWGLSMDEERDVKIVLSLIFGTYYPNSPDLEGGL